MCACPVRVRSVCVTYVIRDFSFGRFHVCVELAAAAYGINHLFFLTVCFHTRAV